MMDRPLAGLRVVDLTRALAGPFATMALADLGADVIKIEPTPKGDMIRQWGPFDEDTSVYYLSANRNKRCLGINFRSKAGMDVIRQMIEKADIVVENFKVGTMEAMGLDYESLSAKNPRLIMASISGFGDEGPAKSWPGFDQIAQGYSGLMSVTGTPDTGATRVGIPVGDMTAGLWMTVGVLSAVVERANTGRGQHVKTSLLSSLLSLMSVQGQRYLSLGEVPVPMGNAHPVIFTYGSFMAADGLMNIAPATTAMWENVCELLGLSHLVTDERFLTNADRVRNREVLQAEFDKALGSNSRAHWTEVLLANGVPAGPINTIADAMEDRQVQAMHMVESVAYPNLGDVRHVGLPVRMPSVPDGHSVFAPAPEFGQHSVEVLREFGWEPSQIEQMMADDVIYQRQS
jgi:crotonobetainyl-CoA:carnitine CoA-transferase CaiB-like acyl-CoA transferase